MVLLLTRPILLQSKAAATAAVKTVASTGVTPTDWSIVLSGAKTQTVTKSYFEIGLACPRQATRSSGPMEMAMFGVVFRFGYLSAW